MITPYKGREIDFSRPVRIYRNLNSLNLNFTWSIKQGSLVVAHAGSVAISRAVFIVSAKGNQRARRSGHRNVHAYCEGYIEQSLNVYRDKWHEVNYNPYNNTGFTVAAGGPGWVNIKSAEFVILERSGFAYAANPC